MIKIDKKLKELIKTKKISDEALIAFAESFTPAVNEDADQDLHAPENESVGETTEQREAFTEVELKVMIAKAVAEATKTAAADQPDLDSFKIVNNREEPRFRVLKMNNR